MKEKFIQFLKKHRAYRKYLKNLKKGHKASYTFDEYWPEIEKINPIFLLVASFKWSKTPEGFEFWDKLDKLWYKQHKQ